MTKRTSTSNRKAPPLKRDEAHAAQEVVIYHWERILLALVLLLALVGGLVWGGLTLFARFSQDDTTLAQNLPPEEVSEIVDNAPAKDSTTVSDGAEPSESQGSESETPVESPAREEPIAQPMQAETESDDAAPVPQDEGPTAAETQEATAEAPENTEMPPPAPESAEDERDEPEASLAGVEIQSDQITQARLTRRVQDNQPAAHLPAVVPMNDKGLIRVYFFTEMQGLAGETVYHDWYLGDERMARVTIRPNSDTMRASSSKFIDRHMLGDWVVKVHTAAGQPLASGRFSVQ